MSTTENAGPAGDVDLAGAANLAFLEELFERFQHDPASVDPEWRASFEALAADGGLVALPGAGGNRSVAASSAPAHVANGHSKLVAQLTAPDGIATAHAVAISNGEVKLPAAPAGEAKPLPLPPVALGTKGEERVAFLQD